MTGTHARFNSYWAKTTAGSKFGIAAVVILCAALLADHVLHTSAVYYSLLLISRLIPAVAFGCLFLGAKIINYRLVNGHIKIVALGVFTLADLPTQDIVSVQTVPPFTLSGQKKHIVYRLGNSFGECKVITMGDGRVFSITPEPGSAVHSFLSLRL